MSDSFCFESQRESVIDIIEKDDRLSREYKNALISAANLFLNTIVIWEDNTVESYHVRVKAVEQRLMEIKKLATDDDIKVVRYAEELILRLHKVMLSRSVSDW
jgi:hypothetical protein